MGAGFYLEASHPGYVRDMSVESIAEAIAADCGVSEDDPEVCAGIIGEIGVSKDFTPAEEKVLRGAARASKMSGAPLSIHLPGWERLAHRVLDVVESEGADLRHTVLCHMNPSLHDLKYQRSLADRGAFIEYDMIGMDYFYADQQAQSPCDEENAIAICKLVEDGYLNSRADVAGRVPEDDADALRRVRLRLHPQAFRASAEAPRHEPGDDRSHPDRESAPRVLGRASRAAEKMAQGRAG